MDKRYDPGSEQKIYRLWEKSGAFTPTVPKNKARQSPPFTIILPLPNASDPMHMGHAMFVIQDILCRWHRMMGEPVLWLPGADHAGIETQYIFEKRLSETGKSRFDYDRKTLYKLIWDYVEENRKINQFQLKELGFSLDWTRYHYSLEPNIVNQVLKTFRKLYQDDLLYRAERIVNYCTHCGTAFSDLEIDHVERDDFLYYLDYGPIKIATTRPETIFVDVAVAVNPKDKRYKNLIGKKAIIPLINKEIPIIADDLVEIDFGTGALKITPAHDSTDFEIGQKHQLPTISCIKLSGKMVNTIPEIDELYPSQARKKTIEMLEKQAKLVKTEPLHHTIGICYRCKNVIESLPVPQWYVKTKPLAKPAIESVKKGETKIFPPRFKKTYLDWMENIRDWNISRQIVWGPQIPAYYCLDCNPTIQINFIDKKGKIISGLYQDLKNKYQFQQIKKGLQTLNAPITADYFLKNSKNICPKCKVSHVLQETDTFDTWFLSGQWPLTTLGFNVDNPANSSPDFDYFYPTSVLDTLWDILFFWVGRMMIFGFYLAKKTPFKTVHLHAKVTDEKGQKMSKSKGNVINPSSTVQKYGADALRLALVYGTAPASNISLSDKKIEAMRNFTNKIWNASRFVKIIINRFKEQNPNLEINLSLRGLRLHVGGRGNPDDDEILSNLNQIIKSTTANLEKYRFGQASEDLYQFFWHQFCDVYIEKIKDRKEDVIPVLMHVLITSLKLLHPFIPFVTETIYQDFKQEFSLKKDLLITSLWPKAK
ncbi:valine--tRNA ligase [Patescibacteria group bacterium]|nr:valine--tRNA ligase [Patescibacteria group bacterium]MCG2702601.1 valine--tRNA ligase [Candidatus Parcubacteria bacterium]MBU4210611.1 valine--tRNA ligase [Patescibacteria group bacterium]MBU4265505.1 valine--tRNA ligase [Patescibacteria group bacterium]MBU4390555.1 valine--tRNA ligase [Patescibacteria group bacterium]